VIITSDEEVALKASAEFSMMKGINHPHIVAAIDCIATPYRVAVALSYFPGNPLHLVVQRCTHKRLPETSALPLFVQLLEALDHLHQHRIVHRDVKAENVLVNADLSELKLIDFNIACRLPEKDGLVSPRCTPIYAAPELRRGGSPSEASDIWGAGLCFMLMLTGNSLPGDMKVHPELLMCSTTHRELLSWCLQADDSTRPSAAMLITAASLCTGLAAHDASRGAHKEFQTQDSPSRYSSTSTVASDPSPLLDFPSSADIRMRTPRSDDTDSVGTPCTDATSCGSSATDAA
jgi:serine/threonine protein kinase